MWGENSQECGERRSPAAREKRAKPGQSRTDADGQIGGQAADGRCIGHVNIKEPSPAEAAGTAEVVCSTLGARGMSDGTVAGLSASECSPLCGGLVKESHPFHGLVYPTSA